MGTDAVSKARIETRLRHMEFGGLLSAAEAFRNAFPRLSMRGTRWECRRSRRHPALVERGLASLLRFYNSLNALLGQSRYVAGDEFTIADITALCAVDVASMAPALPCRRTAGTWLAGTGSFGAAEREGVTNGCPPCACWDPRLGLGRRVAPSITRTSAHQWKER